MHHRSDVLEEPVVGAVPYEHDVPFIIVIAALIVITTTEFTPTARDDRPDSGLPHGLEDGRRQLGRIVDHDATEADVHGRRAGVKELGQFRRWIVLRRVAEEEAAYICVQSRLGEGQLHI